MRARGRRPRVTSRAIARLVGVALLATTCSVAPGESGWAGDGSRWPASPAAAELGPSAACRHGAEAPPAGVDERAMTSGGHRRTYRLAVPPATGPDRPAPLVLLLHGYTSTAEAVAARSGVEAAGVAAGAVVVTPQGLGTPSRWSLPGVLPGPDDVRFVGDLLDRVDRSVCVDRGRVFVAGFSNGAAFAAVLGCAMGARLAGLALVAGANMETGCKWPSGLPVVAFHGTADPVVPFGGGPVLSGLLRTRPVHDAVAEWAERDGCRARPSRARVARGAVRVRWGGCEHPQGVTLYELAGWGHWWPRDVATDVAPRPAPLDATAVLLEAFGVG